MSVIKINPQGLSNITPILNNAKSLLEQASNTLNSITIPKTCTSGAVIKRIARQISQESVKTISDLDTWVEETQTKFAQVESKNASILNSIDIKNNDKIKTKVKDSKGSNKKAAAVRMGANLTNLFIQTGAGVSKFGENSLKSMLSVLKGIDSLVQKLDNLDGKSNVSQARIEQADKDSKKFLAKGHTQSAINKFYEENKMGKVLEKTADKPFKKDGRASAVAQGVGNALPSLAAGKVSGGGKVVISTLNSISGFGSNVGEYVAQKKKKSSKNWTSNVNFGKAIGYGASVSLFDNVVDGKIGDKLGKVSKYGTALKTTYEITSPTIVDTAKKISTGNSIKEVWKETGAVTSIAWETAMLGTDKTKGIVTKKVMVNDVNVKGNSSKFRNSKPAKTSKISNLDQEVKLKKEIGNKIYNKSKDGTKDVVLEKIEEKKEEKEEEEKKDKTSDLKNPNKVAKVKNKK